MLVDCQKDVLLEHVDGVPDAGCREALLLDLEDRLQLQPVVLVVGFLFLAAGHHIVLCHLHVLADRKEPQLDLASLVH